MVLSMLSHPLWFSHNQLLKLCCPKATLGSNGLRYDCSKIETVSMRLGKSQNNFVFKASTIWNKLQQYIFSKSESDSNGAIVPGFSTHSDLSISICMPR